MRVTKKGPDRKSISSSIKEGKIMKKIIIITLAILSGLNCAIAKKLTIEQKISDLRQIESYMDSGYGPLVYKKESLNIDLSEKVKKYQALITEDQSNSDFYYMINHFVAEFQDGHFGSWIPTDHKGKIHFSVNWVNDKVLIDQIEREKLDEKKFPFQRGDEIISINSEATADFLNRMKLYRGNGSELSTRALAAYYVTSRRGRFVPVLDGDITYEIRRGTSDIIEQVTLKWELSGDFLDEFKLAKKVKSIKKKSFNRSIISHKSFLNNFFGNDLDSTYHCSGDTRIAIPKDATIIMKKPFVAYYHKTIKGNIGYLRIPHYSPQNKVTGKREHDLRFSQYEYAVKVLEENTNGLIIDQDHNCGGSVSYLERLVGLFMSKPYEPMSFTLLANKKELLSWLVYLNEEDKHTVSYVNGKKVTDLIKKSWLDELFMTPKTSLSGVTLYNPNKFNYTKPILMLIDFMSGSGGDAFPATLQGFGRAKLFGTPTMGLGGHVENLPALNYSGMKLRMTKSLFYRPDGTPIENNGAVPDYPYTITRNDFLFDYKGYQEAYLQTLFTLIK